MVDKIKVKNCKLIELPAMQSDGGGRLSVAEGSHDIPFEIKRIYYIYDLNDRADVRGMHAHKKLRQVIFCINGSFCLGLDDGTNKQDIILNKPNVGIYMGIELWHTMRSFSQGCVLMVLASDYYDESDYIRGYSRFLEYLDEHK